jgi:predicted DNA-binding protein
MSTRDDAAASLESRDWAGAVPVEGPRTPSIVQSVRMPRDLTERLLGEAQRRGVTPSELIREFVEAGLTDVDESATVRLADVRRVIDTLAARAA